MGTELTLYNNTRLRLYTFVVIVIGTIVFVMSLSRVNVLGWKEITAFILLYFLSQLLPARLPQGDIFSVTIFLDMVLIVLFGTPFAVTVGFGVTVFTRICSALFGNHDPLGNIIKIASQNALVIAVTGLTYSLAGTRLLAFVLSTVVYFSISIFFLLVNSRLSTRNTSITSWMTFTKMLLVNYAVLATMAYVMTLIYTSTSDEWKVFAILLFFVPILLVTHAFRMYADIQKSYLNTVRTITAAIEANDFYIRGHSERVSELALALGKELGFAERELQKLQYVALLHDVGKIGISDSIMNKPSTLSGEEYEDIKRHSAIGAEILKKVQFLSGKSQVILHHHENYDGSGYPAGLKKEEIPLESRLLAIVDAYDAMTTERPYRRAISPKEAVEELVKCSGVQFDPALVKEFKTVLRKMGEI